MRDNFNLKIKRLSVCVCVCVCVCGWVGGWLHTKLRKLTLQIEHLSYHQNSWRKSDPIQMPSAQTYKAFQSIFKVLLIHTFDLKGSSSIEYKLFFRSYTGLFWKIFLFSLTSSSIIERFRHFGKSSSLFPSLIVTS